METMFFPPGSVSRFWWLRSIWLPGQPAGELCLGQLADQIWEGPQGRTRAQDDFCQFQDEPGGNRAEPDRAGRNRQEGGPEPENVHSSSGTSWAGSRLRWAQPAEAAKLSRRRNRSHAPSPAFSLVEVGEGGVGQPPEPFFMAHPDPLHSLTSGATCELPIPLCVWLVIAAS